jgi:hypothetical protein
MYPFIWHANGTRGHPVVRRQRSKRYYGNVRTLPSGRVQARYTGPDGRTHTARTPEGRPLTFDTKGDAEAWLTLRHSEILRGAWLPPAEPKAAPVTLQAYADAWLVGRDLEQTTRDHYGQLLRDHVYPTFGDVAVVAITPTAVREWHARLKAETGPTARAHAYGLLRTICNTAVADDARARRRGRMTGINKRKIRDAQTKPFPAALGHGGGGSF